jgi:glycosyltransferase involved in cell wall biosynthesis
MESYACYHGLAVSIHVVPDIAETWDTYRATIEAVTGSAPLGELEEPVTKGPLDPRHVLWVGNYGAGHSSSGMFFLKPHLRALRSVSRDIPLELVIVSNNEAIYQVLVEDCGFPTRYVPWSPRSVYSELRKADVALVTEGHDESSAVGSSHRVVQALAAGVPVITSKNASNTEFQDALFLGRTTDALRLCLGPSRDRAVPPLVEAAGPVLDRYTPERLGGIWDKLLTNSITRARIERTKNRSGKVLVFIEPGDMPSAVKSVVAAAKKFPTLDYELITSAEVLEGEPDFGAALHLARTIPRFVSDLADMESYLLAGCSAAVVERPAAPVAKRVVQCAEELGVAILTSRQAANGGLSRFAAAVAALPPRSNIVAGLYQERSNPDGSVDWAFIVDRKGRGWILDAICREIGSRQPGSWQVAYHPNPSPNAKNLFFSHYALLLKYYADGKLENLNGSNSFVWYTHPREEDPVTVARLLLALEKVTKVIFACESNRRIWLDRGLPEEKTAVILGAADPTLFRFHERGRGLVGLSSSFYERKNPDCLLELVKRLPHRNFLLLGRKWNQYARFEELRALPNFTYKSAPYRDYPEIYGTFDVFLSMSTLEGGPIPLVEAMMSNAVPVASRTGFAPDLIQHGENGFIFELDAPAEAIAEMIEAAFELPGNIRETVDRYSWDNFSAEVMALAQ